MVKGTPRGARLPDIGKVFAENPRRGTRARFRYSVILNLAPLPLRISWGFAPLKEPCGGR